MRRNFEKAEALVPQGSQGGGARSKSSYSKSLGVFVSKRRLLTALAACVAFALPACAEEHVTDITEAINRTFEGYETTGTGGAVYSAADLAVKGSTFNNNIANSNTSVRPRVYGYGGAVYTQGNLTISDGSSFQNNQSDASGGAVYSRGELTISNTNFSDNSSSSSGGAINSFNNVNISDNTTFERNHSVYNGGAAYFSGGGKKINISSAKFIENSSTSATSAGGAVYSNGHDLEISSSEFTRNTSGKNGGAVYNTGYQYNHDNHSALISGTKFIANKATGDNYGNGYGGAVYNLYSNMTISSSDFSENEAAYGGAITNENASLTINNNTSFSNNKALTDNKGYGGAIYNMRNSSLEIENTQFNVNNAIFGGAIYNNTGNTAAIGEKTIFSENNATKNGGAIYNISQKEKALSVTSALFSKNTAQENGGAIFNEGNAEVTSTVFSENTATQNGGAFFNNSTSDPWGNKLIAKADIISSQFNNNHAENGGAIINVGEDSVMNLTETIFNGNKASVQGGAILSNASAATNITDSQFLNNNASSGGAIVNGKSVTTINSSVLEGNSASEQAGAILNSLDGGTLVIQNNTQINNNTAESVGGAISSFANMSITGSSFSGNKVTASDDEGGGAIFLGAESATTIDSVTFKNNESATSGGAIATRSGRIANNSAATLDITNSTFEGNKAANNGGAILNTFYKSTANGNAVNIYNNKFNNNSAGKDGGAMYNDGTTDQGGNVASIAVNKSDFNNNIAGANGGAIATNNDTTVTDSNFTNNSAGGKGGAIWANKNLTINAINSNVTMTGNSAGEGGDIYMNSEGANLAMNANEGKTITVTGGISGNENGYIISINSNSTNAGSIELASAIQNANIAVANGTLHLAQGSALNNSTLSMAGGTTLNTINNSIDTFGNNVTLADNVNLAVDLNLSNNTADNFSGSNVNGHVNLTDINPIGNTANSNGTTIDIANALGIDSSNLSISPSLLNTSRTILTPVRYLRGSVNEAGLYTMAPTGNSYKDFNPSVLAAPIAAQLGGYFSQLNSYDEAFRNLDMKMLMTREERQAYKMANRYAAAGETPKVFSPTYLPEKDSAGWFRPFSTFENVRLKNGPKVSNVMYGAYFGGDSKIIELSHGWDYQWSVYVGYNGSHQAYSGQSIYQNGGNIGATGIWYKDDFFTALTVNVGASAAEASTMYGNDNFAMLMTGVASKTGYNWELAHGKFIVQPSFLMSYTFVNTFDYTNAAGVRMDSDPLHAINIAPGLKFIGNLKNGWQPYVSVRMVWNIMDKTDFTAANSSLPDMSTDPYIQYGVGVQKRWGERFTGFLQAMLRNGGRNGIALSAGFRWAIGKEGSSGKAYSKSSSTKSKKVIKAIASNPKVAAK